MDGASASHPYPAVGPELDRVALAVARSLDDPTSRRERRGVRRRGLGASPPGAASGADLGGSSKYSGEAPED